MLRLGASFLTFGDWGFLRLGVSLFLRLGFRNSYVSGLAFLRLGGLELLPWVLVFLRLGFSFFTFGG